jgi:F-type H+-transporting ATPase subunit b
VNLNLTLLGQLIAFLIFVWFCMKFVWPPITAAIAERQKKIAEGLDAADRAARSLEDARAQVEQEMQQARAQITEMIEQANRRANQIVEEAQDKARLEAEKIMASSSAQIAQEVAQARESLRTEVASLALVGAERVLGASLDQSAHSKLLADLAEQL